MIKPLLLIPAWLYFYFNCFKYAFSHERTETPEEGLIELSSVGHAFARLRIIDGFPRFFRTACRIPNRRWLVGMINQVIDLLEVKYLQHTYVFDNPSFRCDRRAITLFYKAIQTRVKYGDLPQSQSSLCRNSCLCHITVVILQTILPECIDRTGTAIITPAHTLAKIVQMKLAPRWWSLRTINDG